MHWNIFVTHQWSRIITQAQRGVEVEAEKVNSIRKGVHLRLLRILEQNSRVKAQSSSEKTKVYQTQQFSELVQLPEL